MRGIVKDLCMTDEGDDQLEGHKPRERKMGVKRERQRKMSSP
jgi:hypothetical protein